MGLATDKARVTLTAIYSREPATRIVRHRFLTAHGNERGLSPSRAWPTDTTNPSLVWMCCEKDADYGHG